MKKPDVTQGPTLVAVVGECYRATVVQDGEKVQPGDLCVVVELSPSGNVGWSTALDLEDRTSHHSTAETFASQWEHVPRGEEVLRARAEEVGRTLAQVEISSVDDRVALFGASPHVEMVVGEGVSSEALVPVVADMTAFRGQIVKVRNNVAKLQHDMKKQQRELRGILALQRARVEAVLKAQMDALAAKMGDLKGLIARAEEAIWTINLYMGKNEEIVQIKKGRPAPKDSKISVRQRVLFADEECAIAADEGGIDAAEIATFDKWLKVPEHRQQVLPEVKGVVAFKPRRYKKKYDTGGDAGAIWGAAQLDKANRKTYFLMANGENLYRICTDLEVGDTLVPTSDEVSDLFFSSEYDPDTGGRKREPIYPGDERYMAAMEAADEVKKHYLRILLFLQGLLDRTAVFAPLPAPGLNLLNRNVYRDHLVFINDAEKLLDTGRPSFEVWRDKINGRLDVGHRIIGAFDSWSHGLRHWNRERGRGNERISPSGASFPESLTLYEILGQKDRGWFFRYLRTDEVYRPRTWRTAAKGKPFHGASERRASCQVEAKDEFILNFDLAEVADMEWYLADRTNRHAYEEMFPVLKKAVEVKKREAVEEAPFRDLLAREIATFHGVKLEEAVASVYDLVSWYKFKNKTHRALVAPKKERWVAGELQEDETASQDDAKALRMIVREFGLRKKLGAGSSLDDEAKVFIFAAEPDAILVARTRTGGYVSLTPSNQEKVFVTTKEWSGDGGRLEVTSEERWQTVEQKRLLSWVVLYRSDVLDSWKVDARPADYLTVPERDLMLDEAYPQVCKEVARETWGYDGKKRKRVNLGLLCVTMKDDVFHFWAWSRGGVVPDRPLTGDWEPPEMVDIEVRWSKKKGVVKPSFGYGVRGCELDGWRGRNNERPWAKADVLRRDDVLVSAFEADVVNYDEKDKVRRALVEVVDAVVGNAQEIVNDRTLQKKKEEFLSEYEHEELWEDHKKTIPEHKWRTLLSGIVGEAARFYVDHLYCDEGLLAVEVMNLVEGMTFGGLVDVAKEAGWKEEKPKKKRDASKESNEEGVFPADVSISFDDYQRDVVARLLGLKEDEDEDDDQEDEEEDKED